MPIIPRSSRDRTEAQRSRILSVFVRPLLFWMLLPGMVVALTVAFVTEELLWPIYFAAAPEWAFLVVIVPLTLASGVASGISGFILYMRCFLRYRTTRLGRARALRDFIDLADSKASWFRRAELSLYGIARDEYITASEA